MKCVSCKTEIPDNTADCPFCGAAQKFTPAELFVQDILEDGNVEIKKYKGNDENVVIPAEIDGKSVAKIGVDAFSSCESPVSITIPDSVSEIGRFAFFN